MHPNPLPRMIRIEREIWPRRQTRQISQNVTSQLARSITPARGAMPAACPRGPDADPARRRSTYNPRIMAGLARQMASARCSVREASCRVITVTTGFFWGLDVLPKWLPGHPGGPGLHAATGEHYTVGLRQTASPPPAASPTTTTGWGVGLPWLVHADRRRQVPAAGLAVGGSQPTARGTPLRLGAVGGGERRLVPVAMAAYVTRALPRTLIAGREHVATGGGRAARVGNVRVGVATVRSI
jgi:hypothetical protein